jgi:hypothetical protein
MVDGGRGGDDDERFISTTLDTRNFTDEYLQYEWDCVHRHD